jgi:hypothetical protein
MEGAEYNRHWRARVAETAKDASRHATPCNAGRAEVHRPSEALHPTRSSDVLPRIARKRVPIVPRVAKNASKCATTPGLLRRDAVYTPA